MALKYGISLADLRRANHLWPSDPIHLRKILYVPLDKSHKAKDIFLKLAEDNSASEEHSGQLPSFNASAEERRYPQHGLTIRKVPASTLSFFPPPQTSAGDDSIRDSQSDIRHTRPTRPTIPPDLIDLTEPHATAPASQLSILSTPPLLITTYSVTLNFSLQCPTNCSFNSRVDCSAAVSRFGNVYTDAAQ